MSKAMQKSISWKNRDVLSLRVRLHQTLKVLIESDIDRRRLQNKEVEMELLALTTDSI